LPGWPSAPQREDLKVPASRGSFEAARSAEDLLDRDTVRRGSHLHDRLKPFLKARPAAMLRS